MSHKQASLLSLLFLFIMSAAAPASSQTVIGQYEDEAPLRTWNTFAFTSAAALGRGDVSFSLASDASVAFANPALLTRLSGLGATINGSYQRASMAKYGPVNTSDFKTSVMPELGIFSLDFGGAAYRFGKWTLAAAIAVTEIYDRPDSINEWRYSSGRAYYRFSFFQTGLLRNVNVSLARSLFDDRLSVGLGVNYVFGNLDNKKMDESLGSGYAVADIKNYKFTGIFLNGGATLRITDRWTAALVFRTPYHLKATAKSQVRFTASGTDFSLYGEATNTYSRPFMAGAGLGWQPSSDIRLSVDISWFPWSSYTAEFFGNPWERSFRDIVKVNVGGEYRIPLSLMGKKAALPIRIGFVVDPQPMKNPKSVYYLFTAGTGLQLGRLTLDLGAMIGKESGSGNSLTVSRIASSLSVVF